MAAPLEYLIIGFPENDFSGEIASDLASLVEAGIIRIVDLVFVARGADGSALALEVDEHDHLSAWAALDADVGGVIGPEDLEHAAESIIEGSSVLVLVWEDLWAKPLIDSMKRAGGELIEGGRIPAALSEDLETALAAAG